MIERLLESSKPEDAILALLLADEFGDDALTPKLVALAMNPGPAPKDSASAGDSARARGAAMFALALNRTDEGVKTLKTLLNDPDPKISKMAENAMRYAFMWRGPARGRPLRADDFEQNRNGF